MQPPIEIRTQQDAVNAAKFYRDFLGVPIIPIPYGDKRPPLLGEKWQERGLPTDAEIEGWGRQWGAFNLAAVYNGAVVAIDVDAPEFVERGMKPEEFDLLKKETMVVKTGRAGGGYHIYYRVPAGGVKNKKWNLPTSNGHTEQLDLRAHREYALLPGSKHPSGTFYSNVGAWKIRETTNERLGMLLDKWASNLGGSPESAGPKGKIKLEPLPRWIERLLGIYKGKLTRDPVPLDDGINRLDYRVLAPALVLGGFDDADAVDAVHRWAAASAAAKNVQLQETREKILSTVKRARGNLEEGKYYPWSLRQIEENWPSIYAELLRRRVVTEGEHIKASAEPEKPPEPVPGVEVRAPPEECGPDGFPLTDWGNAERLVAAHGVALRYVAVWGKWLVWDGVRWVKDETGAVFRNFLSTVAGLYHHAGVLAGERRETWLKWLRDSEEARRIRNGLEIAGNLAGVALGHAGVDADPWALNVANGTVDLRTGELRPHNPKDHFMKLAPVNYDAGATAPVWEAFLEKIIPDPEVRGYLQRAAGYSLTGDVSEQALVFLWGTGANGKSTFLNSLLGVVGDYGMRAPRGLVAQRQGDRHPAELAELFGSRLVVSAEVAVGEEMADDLVKDLTGGDTIKARFLYKDFFEFQPTFKIWVAGNHKPIIKGVDHAIMRRIHLVPFTVTIPEGEMDRGLGRRLVDERPGILGWMVRGCMEWQKGGLRPPAAVLAAVEEYRTDLADSMADWMGARCETGREYAVPSADLYADYIAWCKSGEEKPWGKRAFSLALGDRGFATEKAPGGRRLRRGIRLIGAAGLEDIVNVKGAMGAKNDFPELISLRAGNQKSYRGHMSHAQHSDSHAQEIEFFTISTPPFLGPLGESHAQDPSHAHDLITFRSLSNPTGVFLPGEPIPDGLPAANLAALHARGATTRLPPPPEAATCPRCGGTWAWGATGGWVWGCCGTPAPSAPSSPSPTPPPPTPAKEQEAPQRCPTCGRTGFLVPGPGGYLVCTDCAGKP